MTSEAPFDSDSYGTPQFVFDWANSTWGPFDLDVCATQQNAKVERFYTKEDDGLRAEWGVNNWCNPPYSDPSPWISKAVEHWGRTVVLALADSSTRWFATAWERANQVLLLNQRIKFDGAKNSAKFASVFFFFDPRAYQARSVSLVKIKRPGARSARGA
jgi:phage N-6-adenine-methyltransferase